MKFYDRNGETERRPDAGLLYRLDTEAQEKMNDASHHKPGDGWHHVPGEVEMIDNGKYWYAFVPTSEGAILAHVEDICRLKGQDFEAVYRRAYPDEEFNPVTDDDRAACLRPATLDDIPAILDDLTDVNYSTLRSILEDAIETGIVVLSL